MANHAIDYIRKELLYTEDQADHVFRFLASVTEQSHYTAMTVISSGVYMAKRLQIMPPAQMLLDLMAYAEGSGCSLIQLMDVLEKI